MKLIMVLNASVGSIFSILFGLKSPALCTRRIRYPMNTITAFVPSRARAYCFQFIPFPGSTPLIL